MSQQQGNFARRVKTMFNDYRYPMPQSREPVEGAKYPARWTWELTLSGKPCFKVNDGVFGQQDRNAKSKEVEMDWGDRNTLLNLMQNAIDDPSFTKAQYNVRKKTFGSGGRMNDQPSTLATFTVIRNGDGKITVGYTKGTYKVLFDFTCPNDSTIMIQKDGQAVSAEGLMSRMYCKAFIDFSRKFLDQFEFDGYKPKEPKDGGNGGNGGGGNNWGNRGGNGGGNGGGNNNWGGQNNGGGNGGGGNRQQPADNDFDDVDF